MAFETAYPPHRRIRPARTSRVLVIVYSKAGNFLAAELLSKFLQLQEIEAVKTEVR
jgi:hypothetical protein